MAVSNKLEANLHWSSSLEVPTPKREYREPKWAQSVSMDTMAVTIHVWVSAPSKHVRKRGMAKIVAALCAYFQPLPKNQPMPLPMHGVYTYIPDKYHFFIFMNPRLQGSSCIRNTIIFITSTLKILTMQINNSKVGRIKADFYNIPRIVHDGPYL